MNSDLEEYYGHIRSGGAGYFALTRGLIAVWGREAIQFLDGMVSNDMKTLADGAEMLAAFPNAQGRLIAVVRVLRQGDRYLFETEAATREKVFQNLFRFTFAGDFFVEDLSENYEHLEVFGSGSPAIAGSLTFSGGSSSGVFLPLAMADEFRREFAANGAVEISDDLYETLRIENGTPKYGVDMDETTIVPELGLDDMISYTKGCYIGQEIIARIHFRGHVAKRLIGLTFEEGWTEAGAEELAAADGKNAGRITSSTYSPGFGRYIALAFVRYDYLAAGTELFAGDAKCTVTPLPFI